VTIEALQSMCSPRPRAVAFRVSLAGGRQHKVSLASNRAHAARIEYVLRCLGRDELPQALARNGRALLFEWVEGEPLASRASTPLLESCAKLQASINLEPLPDDCPYAAKDLSMVRSSVESDVRALADAAIIGGREAALALETAQRFAPVDCALGFVHRDFCAENLVVRSDGSLRSIDNESVSIGPLDFDLARTWYRWPMNGEQRRSYLAAYERTRSAETFLKHFPFWALAVLADSAHLRHTAAPSVLAVPVRRLHDLLAVMQRRGGVEELAYEQ
jgi:hypothetical protein